MLRLSILVIHIFLASIWVGGILFIGWGVFPASTTLSLSKQRQFLISLMKWSHHIFSLAGLGVIITGILLGTVVGPLHNMDAILNTAYGKSWLAALLTGTFTLVWGIVVGYREMMLVFKNDYFWTEAQKGNKKPLLGQFIRLAILESVEGIGFIILIIIMVTLH